MLPALFTVSARFASSKSKQPSLCVSPALLYIKANFKKSATSSVEQFKALHAAFKKLSPKEVQKYTETARANSKILAKRRKATQMLFVNAYSLFAKEALAVRPKATSLRQGALAMQEVAKQWKLLTATQKEKYAESAKQIRAAAKQKRKNMAA